MDKEDKISICIKEEEEEEEEEDDMDLDLDFDSELEDESVGDEEEDWNEDFEQVEEMTSPWVSSWIDPATGSTVHGVEVAVMKDDGDEDDVIRRDYFGPKNHMEPAEICSICFGLWTSHQNHRICCLPCGHIFGISCIKKWLQTGSSRKCPQCNTFCTLKDVRPLHATRLYNPAADLKFFMPASTRRFPFSRLGLIAFKKFEFGRRNFALNKKSDALKRLADVMRWKNDAMKRRTESLHKMDYVLKLAKAMELQADSMGRADALRLRANKFGRQADEYLRRDKAFEGRGKALLRRIKAFDQRSNAFLARFIFFNQSYEDFHGIASQKNAEQCAAATT